MFQLLSTITLKFGICLYNVKKYAQQYIKNINKNIFNNFLIAESRRTHTHFFKKLPSPAPAPESRNAPVLHSFEFCGMNKIVYEHCYVLCRTVNEHLPTPLDATFKPPTLFDGTTRFTLQSLVPNFFFLVNVCRTQSSCIQNNILQFK